MLLQTILRLTANSIINLLIALNSTKGDEANLQNRHLQFIFSYILFMSHSYYIGLMSGTSLDGVDGVLVAFPESIATNGKPLFEVLAHTHIAMSHELRSEFLRLNHPTENELHRGAVAANRLIDTLYVPAVQALLSKSGFQQQQITAIGAHGQTIRHLPQLAKNDIGYSIQLNAPALLAERTGITVVSDFRNRDIAAGGQGAPLVPAFHAHFFSVPDQSRVVLNLGGIANITILHPNGPVIGFDCGPANALMDEWSEEHTGYPYDKNGQWAASGHVIPELLNALLKEPYFSLTAPKSTGRDLFNRQWLSHHLYLAAHATPEDVQATLLELTAQSIWNAITTYATKTDMLLVCGGGVKNTALMQRLQQIMHPILVKPTDALHLPADQVEAIAFAWLAKQCMIQMPGNLPIVTGAKGERILGAIYQA